MNESPFQFRLINDEVDTQEQPFKFRSIDEESSPEEIEEAPIEEPGLLEKAKRQLHRIGVRVTAGGAGLPGDIYQTLEMAALHLPGGITPEEKLNFAQKGVKNLLQGFLSTDEINEKANEIYPELKAEGGVEETADEIATDFGTLINPIGGGLSFMKSLGMSVFGNLGKQAAKGLGFDETTQELTKMGSMLFAGMFSRGRGINSHIENLYKESKEFIPAGEMIQLKEKPLNKLKKSLGYGSVNDAKSEALNLIEEIEKKTANGLLIAEDAIQFDKDINRAIQKAGRDEQKSGNLKQVKKAYAETLDNYAQQNPSWAEKYNEAKQAYSGIAQSEKVQASIRSNLNLSNLKNAAILFGLEEFAIPGRAATKIAGLSLGAASLYATEVARRLAKNPALRKYYSNVITASMADNKPLLARSMKGLEKAAAKEFEADPWPDIIDEDQE